MIFLGYGITIGQNWASMTGVGSWSKAVSMWHSEVSMYRYGQNPNNYLANKGGWLAIGHYTQVSRYIYTQTQMKKLFRYVPKNVDGKSNPNDII